MTDLALDGNDLALPLAVLDGAEAVRQALQIRLNFFRGEWFLDTEAGVPYFQQIFGQKLRYGLADVDAIFKDQIIAAPGVQELVSYSSTLAADRSLTVTFTVRAFDQDIALQASLPIDGPSLVYIISGIR